MVTRRWGRPWNWIALAVAAGALWGPAAPGRAGPLDLPRSPVLSPAQLPEPLALLSGLGSRQPAPAPVPARSLPRRLRRNTIGVGLQGQYGVLSGSSAITDGFDHGPGYAFRFRYLIRPGFALGFSFEHQRFGSRINDLQNLPGAPPDSHMVINTVSGEGVFYFHRERETHPYLVAGFGHASPNELEERIPGGEKPGPRRVNEGPFLVLGGGFEHFVRQRFSIDGSLRGYAEIGNSELTLVTQLALGIHLYPGD